MESFEMAALGFNTVHGMLSVSTLHMNLAGRCFLILMWTTKILGMDFVLFGAEVSTYVRFKD